MAGRPWDCLLSGALILGSAHIVYTGASIASGAIPTWGGFGRASFAYDSYLQLIGGLWIGVGLLALSAVRTLAALKVTVR